MTGIVITPLGVLKCLGWIAVIGNLLTCIVGERSLPYTPVSFEKRVFLLCFVAISGWAAWAA